MYYPAETLLRWHGMSLVGWIIVPRRPRQSRNPEQSLSDIRRSGFYFAGKVRLCLKSKISYQSSNIIHRTTPTLRRFRLLGLTLVMWRTHRTTGLLSPELPSTSYCLETDGNPWLSDETGANPQRLRTFYVRMIFVTMISNYFLIEEFESSAISIQIVIPWAA